MKILSLTLENFRGIKELSIDFDGKNTDIYGANGLGKTTIANAICWLLIDRPATEEANFDPKTVGEHCLHHKAEIRLELDGGEEMAFSKDFYEKHTKKKGSATAEYTGNAVDYYIDGVKSRQKDYNTAIERVLGVPADKAKALLVLSYFAESLKTDDKRKILFEMAGEFTDEDVLRENKELAGLKEFLQKPGTTDKYYTIDQWKQIATDGRKRLNKELELIPTRIDEARRSLPETDESTEEITAKLERNRKQREDLMARKAALLADDGRAETMAGIAKLEADLERKRAEHIRKEMETKSEVDGEIRKLGAELRDIDDGIYRDDRRLSQVQESISSMEEKRKALMNEYAATRQETWDAGQEVCPTCGQRLPADKIASHRAEFNRRKSEKLMAINRRGQSECSQTMIEAARKEAEGLEEKLKTARVGRMGTSQRLRNLKEAELPQTPFESTEEYREIKNQLWTLKSKVDNDTAENIALNYDYELSKLNNASNALTEKLARVKAVEGTKARIEELETELRETSASLERLEHGIHLCEEFTRTKARMVTDSINRHFSQVRFILFRDQINGGMKEVCEPTCQNNYGAWVEYRSLNFADKINAQLDIVNTLNRHYGTNLPVIMDQGESVTNPLPIEEQFIRLIVSAEDKDFRIVHEQERLSECA